MWTAFGAPPSDNFGNSDPGQALLNQHFHMPDSAGWPVAALSMLLLMVMFRSVTVAVKAAVMNLLSISAAYGVLVLVVQDGMDYDATGDNAATA